MREYKFRAWDKRKEKFRDDVYIDSDGNLYEFSKKTGYGTAISYLNDEYIDVTQYTGLVDINGKEIYEGDIVKNTTQQSYLGQTYEVTWNENWACYQLMDNGLTSNIPLSQDFMSYEVIGNIYENPELIKGRQ